MFRLPATFCKIKVSGSKTVGGVTVLINLVWIDMHTEGASSSLCLFPGKDFRFMLPAVPEKFIQPT